jgi:DNA-binding Xre family transcriptional regulator
MRNTIFPEKILLRIFYGFPEIVIKQEKCMKKLSDFFAISTQNVLIISQKIMHIITFYILLRHCTVRQPLGASSPPHHHH